VILETISTSSYYYSMSWETIPRQKTGRVKLSCHTVLSAGAGAKSKWSSSTANTSEREDTLKSGLTSSGKDSRGPYLPVPSSKQVKAPALFPQTTCEILKHQVIK
jgi:hypothetical protein